MMNILVAFGTSEGQTRKIAEAVATQILALGHKAKLFDTAQSPVNLRMGSYDKIIVAASVHQKQHQDSVEIFVRAGLTEVQERPTLFLSVSLSAAFSQGMAEAQSYIDAFLASTGWKPTQSLPVAGALRYAEYDYFKEQIIEYVVMKGRKVEGPGGDHEFTDWESLAQVIDTFVKS